ncbi:hypothetical protein T07_5078 [Trichinella nelsoni]|uniref:Uncharacterized protein n=1 Tax=Trichinella nelsoni TaxID=6336 RepID=A0A0V0RLL3_9BILA|nr:hypothetical protein T07_5078 [Trichinella nelsoni]
MKSSDSNLPEKKKNSPTSSDKRQLRTRYSIASNKRQLRTRFSAETNKRQLRTWGSPQLRRHSCFGEACWF